MLWARTERALSSIGWSIIWTFDTWIPRLESETRLNWCHMNRILALISVSFKAFQNTRLVVQYCNIDAAVTWFLFSTPVCKNCQNLSAQSQKIRNIGLSANIPVTNSEVSPYHWFTLCILSLWNWALLIFNSSIYSKVREFWSKSVESRRWY